MSEPLFVNLADLAKQRATNLQTQGKQIFNALPQTFTNTAQSIFGKREYTYLPKTDERAQMTRAVAIPSVDPTGMVGAVSKVGAQAVKKTAEPIFKGFTDLSTKLLKDLEGKSKVAKQYILDATNRPELKQPEKDLFRRLLNEEGDSVDVPTFANKVKSELLPLKTRDTLNSGGGGYQSTRYESINLPDELRGPVADYKERIYSSPIKTSAGDVHFSGNRVPNYFAHSRIEDLPVQKQSTASWTFTPQGGGKYKVWNQDTGKAIDKVFDSHEEAVKYAKSIADDASETRRVIELQSDLFQKGRLEQNYPSNMTGREDIVKSNNDARAKLEPYRNTWHERVIREEVKQAAKDGKTKLQFPTGETAMKIEGLGDTRDWYEIRPRLEGETTGEYLRSTQLTPDKLKVGGTIEGNNDEWIITDVLGDGKFKAVPKKSYDEYQKLTEPGAIDRLNETARELGQTQNFYDQARMERDYLGRAETFDISGKVDTENPIYKFYEKTVQKYLTNKYGGKVITDPQGVKWVEIDVKPDQKNMPIEAFGALFAPLGLANMPDTTNNERRFKSTPVDNTSLFINKQ